MCFGQSIFPASIFSYMTNGFSSKNGGYLSNTTNSYHELNFIQVTISIKLVYNVVIRCEIKLFWDNSEIISVFYFACHYVGNWNKIVSAAERVLKLFQNYFRCWWHPVGLLLVHRSILSSYLKNTLKLIACYTIIICLNELATKLHYSSASLKKHGKAKAKLTANRFQVPLHADIQRFP